MIKIKCPLPNLDTFEQCDFYVLIEDVELTNPGPKSLGTTQDVAREFRKHLEEDHPKDQVIAILWLYVLSHVKKTIQIKELVKQLETKMEVA